MIEALVLAPPDQASAAAVRLAEEATATRAARTAGEVAEQVEVAVEA